MAFFFVYKLTTTTKHKIDKSVDTTDGSCVAITRPMEITPPFLQIQIGSRNKIDVSDDTYLTPTFLGGALPITPPTMESITKSFGTFIQTSDRYIQLKKEGQRAVPSELINKYNVLYIQYLYYQLYIYNNITTLLTRIDYEIYNFLTKDLVTKYYNILKDIHDKYIINNSINVFSSSLNATQIKYGYTFFFKHGIIIKILFYFFESIKNKWDKETWDISYVIDLYQDGLDINIQKYITLFNIYYNIFI